MCAHDPVYQPVICPVKEVHIVHVLVEFGESDWIFLVAVLERYHKAVRRIRASEHSLDVVKHHLPFVIVVNSVHGKDTACREVIKDASQIISHKLYLRLYRLYRRRILRQLVILYIGRIA